jgi:hypothetical protein
MDQAISHKQDGWDNECVWYIFHYNNVLYDWRNIISYGLPMRDNIGTLAAAICNMDFAHFSLSKPRKKCAKSIPWVPVLSLMGNPLFARGFDTCAKFWQCLVSEGQKKSSFIWRDYSKIVENYGLNFLQDNLDIIHLGYLRGGRRPHSRSVVSTSLAGSTCVTRVNHVLKE